MKRILCCSFVFLSLFMVHSSATADVPRRISFQGKLFDDAGNILTGSYEVTFSIYDTDEGGTALWSEVDNVRCEDGLYSIILGSANPIDIDFHAGYWLGVQVTGDAEEMVPRYPLTSVPYAFRAVYADSAGFVRYEAHDHSEETWTGNGAGTGLTMKNFNTGLRIESIDTTVTINSSSGPALVAVRGDLQNDKSDLNNSRIAAEGAENGGGTVYAYSQNNSGIYGRSSTVSGVVGESATGNGVSGHSISGSGITGQSIGGPGVYGESVNHNGVYGYCENNAGTVGMSNTGSGIYGESTSGDGVAGTSGSGKGISGYSESGVGGALCDRWSRICPLCQGKLWLCSLI